MEKPKEKRLKAYYKAYKTSLRLMGIVWDIDRKLFLGNLTASLIPAIIPFVNAYIYKLIIDMVVLAASDKQINRSHIYWLIGFRVATLFILEAAFTLQRKYEVMLWTKLPLHFYRMVLSKISSLDLEHFENSEFKDRLEKVKDTFQWRPLNDISYCFYSIQNLVQLIIATVAIVTLNWYLAVILLVVSVPGFIYQTSYANQLWTIWDNNSPYKKRFMYLSDLLQSAKGIKEIKLFKLGSLFLNQMNSIQKKFIKENSAVALKQYRTGLALNVVSVTIYAVIEIFIVFAAIAKRISVGSVTYFITVVNNFENGASGLFRNLSYIFQESLYVNEMFAVLDTQTKILAPANPVVLKKTAPKIEFKNVSFSYPGTEQKVLNNFNLAIEPGQKIAFVGENGAGKTTIIKLLARFYDVNEGEILIDNINIKDLDLNSWYGNLSVLLQDFIKYEYPLKDNIRFGDAEKPEDIQNIQEAAQQSGADKVAEKLPDGYEQMLGRTFEHGVDLSAGQWQKVALARGFYKNAPVLILDEPTAAIDAKAESEIFEKVESLAKNKTVMIISHRFSTVRNADKIYVIEDGAIKEAGSHDELMAANGTYATLFNLQAKGYK